MFDKIREYIHNAHTPKRPYHVCMILMPIAAVFSIMCGILYLSGGNLGAGIPSTAAGFGYLYGWGVLLLRKFKNENVTAITNHLFFISLCLCAASELAFTVLTIYALASSVTTVTISSVLSVLCYVITTGMYSVLIYFVAYKKDSVLNVDEGKRLRVILCIFNLVLLCIHVIQNFVSFAENGLSLPMFLVSPFITVLTIFLMYYPWVLFVASAQYPDSEVKTFAQRRAEKKKKQAEKKAARKELHQTLRKAVDSTYEPVQSPLLRRKHK